MTLEGLGLNLGDWVLGYLPSQWDFVAESSFRDDIFESFEVEHAVSSVLKHMKGNTPTLSFHITR